MRYSDETRAKVIKYIVSGRTQREACANFRISQPAVSEWWKKYKETGEMGGNNVSKINPIELKAYVKANPKARLEDISKRFGCSYSTAYTTCINLKIIQKKKLKIDPKQLEACVKADPTICGKKLAVEFNCKEASVIRVATKHNIPLMNEHQRKTTNILAYAEQNPSAPHRVIADALGYKTPTVGRILKQHKNNSDGS